jgi:hypothetical protein
MADWHIDDGLHLDNSSGAEVEAVNELSVIDQGIGRPLTGREMDAEFGLEIITTSSIALNLLRLVPEKFRTSQILIDYLDEASIQLGDWFTKVRDIVKLLNARSVSSTTYLRHLGALIGVSFPPEDDATVNEMRKNIETAVEWYKVKGTYKSIQLLSLIYAMTINLYDMYTEDYETFVPVLWFAGNEGENPAGLGATYYKSPHFGVEILLNKVYNLSSDLGGDHLWYSGLIDNFLLKVEETRPAHTVPHYLLLLNPQTDEFGNVIEVEGDVRTKIFGDWQPSAKYLDEVDSSLMWSVDDGEYLDDSAEAFIKSIIKWVLGDGVGDVSDSGWSVSSPILTGSIDPDDITIADDKITFEFTVPKASVGDNLQELGLYIPGSPDTLVIGSTFPKIDKSDDVEIRILVEVYRKQLV